MRKRRIYIVMRNDDPCALSDVNHERRVLSLFEKHGVPHVAAVVPRVVSDPHDDRLDEYFPLDGNPDMLALLREYLAKPGLLEIAQHGDTHQTNPHRPTAIYDRTSPDMFDGIAGAWLPYRPVHDDGYSEFNGLPVDQQRHKILHGKHYLEKLFGCKLQTFIYPWNACDADNLRLLKEAGFEYVLGGTNAPRQNGLCILGACFWWELGNDIYTWNVEEALARQQSSLLHLSFHSWMLKDKDLRLMEAFLARFARHPDVVFLTPNRLPEIAYPLQRSVSLRRHMAQLHHEISRRVWVFYPEDHHFYLFNSLYYLRRLGFYVFAALIFRTLGITGWLVVSGLLALTSGYVLAQPWGRQGISGVLAGAVLAGAVFLFWRAGQLLGMRRKQHRMERAG